MRRLAALLAVLGILAAGCSADPNQPEEGEYLLTQTYEAMGEPYPLTVPVFLACDHFRVVGETEERDLGELFLYTPHQDFTEMTGPLEWAKRYCADQ